MNRTRGGGGDVGEWGWKNGQERLIILGVILNGGVPLSPHPRGQSGVGPMRPNHRTVSFFRHKKSRPFFRSALLQSFGRLFDLRQEGGESRTRLFLPRCGLELLPRIHDAVNGRRTM